MYQEDEKILQTGEICIHHLCFIKVTLDIFYTDAGKLGISFLLWKVKDSSMSRTGAILVSSLLNVF
jgi:hypothetical protein